MENTQEQKTPEQWFQMLREPYRSEAIANIDKEYTFFKDYPKSLEDALENSFNFFDHDQAKWITIFNSIRAGEKTYLEPETLKPEPIELRPEELVSGEVYTFSLPKNDWKWTFKFKGLNLEKIHDQIEYYILYVHHDKKIIFNSSCSHREKYYHATPDEKKLLLGEEETDWEAKYNELKAKYDQLEPKGEKVYFYFNEKVCEWEIEQDKKLAIDKSPNYYTIYEGYSIGKKKSVLVNETT